MNVVLKTVSSSWYCALWDYSVFLGAVLKPGLAAVCWCKWVFLLSFIPIHGHWDLFLNCGLLCSLVLKIAYMCSLCWLLSGITKFWIRWFLKTSLFNLVLGCFLLKLHCTYFIENNVFVFLSIFSTSVGCNGHQHDLVFTHLFLMDTSPVWNALLLAPPGKEISRFDIYC